MLADHDAAPHHQPPLVSFIALLGGVKHKAASQLDGNQNNLPGPGHSDEPKWYRHLPDQARKTAAVARARPAKSRETPRM